MYSFPRRGGQRGQRWRGGWTHPLHDWVKHHPVPWDRIWRMSPSHCPAGGGPGWPDCCKGQLEKRGAACPASSCSSIKGAPGRSPPVGSACLPACSNPGVGAHPLWQPRASSNPLLCVPLLLLLRLNSDLPIFHSSFSILQIKK